MIKSSAVEIVSVRKLLTVLAISFSGVIPGSQPKVNDITLYHQMHSHLISVTGNFKREINISFGHKPSMRQKNPLFRHHTGIAF